MSSVSPGLPVSGSVRSRARWEGLDSCHTSDKPCAHYKAISSHLTASKTDDELPLISLKQSFVPCEAGDSKAPVKPIHLIARHLADSQAGS